MGVNYPIMLPVGGAGVVPGYLTRSNCVYTLANAAWHLNSQLPEVCCFSLNGTYPAVGFQTNALEDPNERNKYTFKAGLVKTPLWFIPSFANAPDLTSVMFNYLRNMARSSCIYMLVCNMVAQEQGCLVLLAVLW